MRVYQAGTRLGRIHAALGQAPASSAAQFALANSKPLLSAITRDGQAGRETIDDLSREKLAGVIGRLAVSADGIHVARIGLTFANTPFFRFHGRGQGMWMTMLGFAGPNRGNVFFVPVEALRGWRIVDQDKNSRLYQLTGIPDHIKTDVTVTTFTEALDGGFLKAEAAIRAALDGDWLAAQQMLNEEQIGVKARMDWARIQLQIMMSVGLFQKSDSDLFTNQVFNPIAKTIIDIEKAIAARDGKALKDLSSRLKSVAEEAGNALENFTEETIIRFLKIYYLVHRYMAREGAIVSSLAPEQSKMLDIERRILGSIIASLQKTGALQRDIKERLAAIDIDADAILTEAQKEAQTQGLEGFGNRAVAIFRRPRLARYVMRAKTRERTAKVIEFLWKHIGAHAWTGIVFGLSHYALEGLVEWHKGERGMIEDYKNVLRLQQTAQLELDEEQAARAEKLKEGIATRTQFAQDMANQHPDPAIQSAILDLVQRTGDIGADDKSPGTKKDEGSTVTKKDETSKVLLVGAAIVGGGYLIYRLNQEKK